jgi:hypothetical protein
MQIRDGTDDPAIKRSLLTLMLVPLIVFATFLIAQFLLHR